MSTRFCGHDEQLADDTVFIMRVQGKSLKKALHEAMEFRGPKLQDYPRDLIRAHRRNVMRIIEGRRQKQLSLNLKLK